MSNWQEANKARVDHEASAEQVAFREAEYDRICPRWRDFRAATNFQITRGRGEDLQRRPFDGSWEWHAGPYASRFSFDGAVAMLKRVHAAGILGAYIAPNVVGTHPPNVTDDQIAVGDIQP